MSRHVALLFLLWSIFPLSETEDAEGSLDQEVEPITVEQV